MIRRSALDCLKSSTLVERRAAWDRPCMTLYTRRQILVLLVLLVITGFGLAVGYWRRARPDAVDYLEQLDRAELESDCAALGRWTSIVHVDRSRASTQTPRQGASRVRAVTRRSGRHP